MAASVVTHSLYESATSPGTNSSSVTYLVQVQTTGSSYNNYSITTTYYIDGTKYTYSHKLPKTTTTTVASNTVTIYHNDDGSRSVSASYSCPTGISAGTLTGSTSCTLTTFGRYAIYYNANGGSSTPSTQTK
jgi:hypothetical protein